MPKKKDFILIGVLLVIALIGLGVTQFLQHQTGASVTIVIPTGHADVAAIDTIIPASTISVMTASCKYRHGREKNKRQQYAKPCQCLPYNLHKLLPYLQQSPVQSSVHPPTPPQE